MDENLYALDLPMGLAGALAKNTIALEAFSSLSHEEKQRVIDHTHVIGSKQEMQAFVDDMAEGRLDC